jgi:hypothetical protein
MTPNRVVLQGGGVTARPKTREQEIEDLRNKISTELESGC